MNYSHNIRVNAQRGWGLEINWSKEEEKTKNVCICWDNMSPVPYHHIIQQWRKGKCAPIKNMVEKRTIAMNLFEAECNQQVNKLKLAVVVTCIPIPISTFSMLSHSLSLSLLHSFYVHLYTFYSLGFVSFMVARIFNCLRFYSFSWLCVLCAPNRWRNKSKGKERARFRSRIAQVDIQFSLHTHSNQADKFSHVQKAIQVIVANLYLQYWIIFISMNLNELYIAHYFHHHSEQLWMLYV